MPAYNAEPLMEKVIRDIPPETMEILDTVLVINDGSDVDVSSIRSTEDRFINEIQNIESTVYCYWGGG